MTSIVLYLIGLIVLLVAIIVRQGTYFKRTEEDIAGLREQLRKLIKGQEQIREALNNPVENAVPDENRWRKYVPEEELQPEEEPQLEEEPLPEEILQPEEEPQLEVIPQPVLQTEIPIQEPPQRMEATVQTPPRKEKKAVNYEKLIGENLFGKIGILVFVIGVGLFVKYAIDKDWINETMRTVLGFLVGSLLLFIAERLREKYRTFSSLLAGGAFAVFYLTVAIAFHYYHLFTQTVAFVILIAITLFMSALAILYDRRELAVIALVGGFLAPFIVSTGEGNYVVLFTYIAILNLGMFGISLYKRWVELPAISFVFTYLVLGLYVLDSFMFGNKELTPGMAGNLFAFAALFYFTFLLPVVLILRNEGQKMNRLLLSLIISNNFLFLGFGCLFIGGMALAFKAEGLLSLVIAIVNLLLAVWLKKNEGDYRFLLYTMIGLVLTFVSITVPIQLDGNYITLFWASEMVLLLWLYIRSRIRVYEYATVILVILTGISLGMDLWDGYDVLVTNLFVSVAAGLFAWMMARYREALSEARWLTYAPWNALMWVVAVTAFYYTFMKEFGSWQVGYTTSLRFLFTVLCIGGVSVAFRKRFPIGKHTVVYLVAIGLSTFIPLTGVCTDEAGPMAALLSWAGLGVIAATLYNVGRMYYECFGVKKGFTIYINILATLLWLLMIDHFLYRTGMENEGNAAFSIGLGIAGLVQMLLGMGMHQKMLRIISLVVFGIVLGKLVLIDLWAMPTVGKIIVFILLGAVLLVLSFLYQKLKNVLFKDDDEASVD